MPIGLPLRIAPTGPEAAAGAPEAAVPDELFLQIIGSIGEMLGDAAPAAVAPAQAAAGGSPATSPAAEVTDLPIGTPVAEVIEAVRQLIALTEKDAPQMAGEVPAEGAGEAEIAAVAPEQVTPGPAPQPIAFPAPVQVPAPASVPARETRSGELAPTPLASPQQAKAQAGADQPPSVQVGAEASEPEEPALTNARPWAPDQVAARPAAAPAFTPAQRIEAALHALAEHARDAEQPAEALPAAVEPKAITPRPVATPAFTPARRIEAALNGLAVHARGAEQPAEASPALVEPKLVALSPAALPFAAAPEPFRPIDTASPAQPIASDPAEFVIEHHLDLAQDGEWLDQLARDIAETVGSDRGPLRFRLNPEQLGALRVEISQDRGGTSVRLTTDSEAARAIIADAQPRLVAEARVQGVRISETHVELGGGQAGSGGERRSVPFEEAPVRTARSVQDPERGDGKPTPRRSDRYA